MNIGDVANPPVAVLPRPNEIFARRSERFEALSDGHELGAYLRFLASLTAAQHEVQARLPEPRLPSAERLTQARENGMPPLAFGAVVLDDTADATLVGIARELGSAILTDAARAAVAKVENATTDERRELMTAVMLDEVPGDAVAEHVLAAAALQVHYARLAARLDVGSLQRIADSACPVCGSPPVASVIVGWDGANGSRFCTCSICSTAWHVVRARCVVCGDEKGVAYRSIEGEPDTVAGETCDACSSYVKHIRQQKDPALEPFVDDVSSLALDMVLGREGFQRATANPFLIGY